MNNQVASEMVTTTGSMSTVTFSPLAASHAGTYTCRVTAGGVTETQTYDIIIVNSKYIHCSVSLKHYDQTLALSQFFISIKCLC